MCCLTAEVITYYLATHCMLAHNETRQNIMIRKYEEAIKLLPPEESHDRLERFTTDQSLPDDYCTFPFKHFRKNCMCLLSFSCSSFSMKHDHMFIVAHF